MKITISHNGKHGLLDKGNFTGGKSIILVNYMYKEALLSQDSTQLY